MYASEAPPNNQSFVDGIPPAYGDLPGSDKGFVLLRQINCFSSYLLEPLADEQRQDELLFRSVKDLTVRPQRSFVDIKP